MPQILEQGDIFGRIGKSVGQGLGEAIPKAQERKYLSEGLKKINPQLGEIYSIPGVIERPDIANQALQYAQSTRAKEAARGINPIEKQPSVSQNLANAPAKEIDKSKSDSEISPTFNRESSNYLTPDTQEDIAQRAADLSDKTGMLFEQAKAIEQERADKRLAAETAFEARADLGRKELGNHVEKLTQKSGNEIYKDLTGEMLGEFETLVDNDIANGKSPRQAALDRGNELLELAKARQQVSIEGAKRWYNGVGSPKVAANLREDYKKNHQLPLYQKDLVNKIGMRPAYAAALTYPPSEHKEIVPYIKNSRKNPGESYQKITDSLGQNDSLQAIALAIEENSGRGSGQKFLDTVQARRKAGTVKLNDDQVRELGEVFRPNPSLTDIWYTNIFGKKAGV